MSENNCSCGHQESSHIRYEISDCNLCSCDDCDVGQTNNEKLQAENERFAEALKWCVGFIRCNYPKGVDYPDFQNAESLAQGRTDYGKFNIVMMQNEVLNEENEKLKSSIKQLFEAFPFSTNLKQTDAVINAHKALGVKMRDEKDERK